MATPSFHRPLLAPPPLPFWPLGSLWEPSWGLLGSPRGLLGASGGGLGSLLGALGGSWEPPEGVLGASWAPWDALGSLWGASWGILGASEEFLGRS